jgi:hypothetical protein
MPIKNGNTPDADEVNASLITSFRGSSHSNDLIDDEFYFTSTNMDISFFSNSASGRGWAETSTGLSSKRELGEYYKDDNASYTIKSNAIPLLSSGSRFSVMPHYNIYELYDECDDSSVNTGLWTKISGTDATEGTKYIQFQNGDYRTNDIKTKKYVTCYLVVNEGNQPSQNVVTFYDGTTEVSVLNFPTTGASDSFSFTGQLNLRIDWVNKKAFLTTRYVGGKSSPGNDFRRRREFDHSIDISSLTGNLYLRFNPPNGGNPLRLYHLRIGKSSPSTTITKSYSVDDSSFTTFDTPFVLSETGSFAVFKATGIVATNEVIVFNGFTLYEKIA